MKYFTVLILVLVFTIHGYGQDDSTRSTPKRLSWLYPHFTNGINFLRSDQLKKEFGTQGLYFWGLGIRIGKPKTSDIFASVDYNFSSYRLSKEVNGIREDSLLRLDQFVPSLSLRLFNVKDFSIHTKAGYIFSYIKDDIHKLDKRLNGFKIGISVQNKILKESFVHMDIDYDLVKSINRTNPNYDVLKLSIGIFL